MPDLPDLQGVQGKLITAEAWQGLTEPRQRHSHNKISFFFFRKKRVHSFMCSAHKVNTLLSYLQASVCAQTL